MKTYIGYSQDRELRYRATSGGVGSSVLKYLFESGMIETAVSFDYDSSLLQYVPRLIYGYEEYKAVGSIYHEIDLPGFLRRNMDQIQGGFACFVLPCQARPVRALMKKNGHDCYLLGLACSSQQSIEATYYLLKRLNIRREEVAHIQYRGNGWPGGVQIEMKDGARRFAANNSSIWTQIFHSRLFIQPRCFRCTNTLNVYADIGLADPWLQEFMQTERIGATLLFVHTENGNRILQEMNPYCMIEPFSEAKALKSQHATEQRKLNYKKRGIKVRMLESVNRNSVLKGIICAHPLLFRLYCLIKKYMER